MHRLSPDCPTERERRVFHGRQILSLERLQKLPENVMAEMELVTRVLPFKVNGYVLDHLIDWADIPDDPVFRLTFPHGEMLTEQMRGSLGEAVRGGTESEQAREAVRRVRRLLNPDPSNQMALNVPTLGGRPLRGVQHKYRETVLLFPSQGQTCHTYCGYCFRWPQFLGQHDLRHTIKDPRDVVEYLATHPAVTDIVITGGDPLVMRTELLERYLEPVLEACPHIQNVRIGTKSLVYWPYRFTWGEQADSLLRLFERVVSSGRSLTVMAHLSHPQEARPAQFRAAVQRILETGATIRSQAPMIHGVNDAPEIWAEMWNGQVRSGITPYYLFVERDTGAHPYYSLPLARALEVYRDAVRSVSGLARTARGPVLSAPAGKILVDGEVEVAEGRMFSTRLLQARDPAQVGRISWYHWSDEATWIDQLRLFREFR